MTAGNPAEDPQALEGLAVIAISVAEMGGTERDIVAAVGSGMSRIGMTLRAADFRAVAGTIAGLPQPLDESAEDRELRRPIESMLGLPSPEDHLTDALKARHALTVFAQHLDASE